MVLAAGHGRGMLGEIVETPAYIATTGELAPTVHSLQGHVDNIFSQLQLRFLFLDKTENIFYLGSGSKAKRFVKNTELEGLATSETVSRINQELLNLKETVRALERDKLFATRVSLNGELCQA